MSQNVKPVALLCLLAAAMAPRILPAQEHPNLSGVWSLSAADGEARRGAPPGRGARSGRVASGQPAVDLGSGWGNEFTLTQTAEQLTVERPLYSRTDMQPPFRWHFALDGTAR